jgi:hypothetical protein
VDADIVEQTCGESYQCKYDYSVTLSREFAIFSKYYQDTFVNIREGVLKPEARGELNSKKIKVLTLNLCLVDPENPSACLLNVVPGWLN